MIESQQQRQATVVDIPGTKQRGKMGRPPKGDVITREIVDQNIHIRRSVFRKFKEIMTHMKKTSIDNKSLSVIALNAKPIYKEESKGSKSRPAFENVAGLTEAEKITMLLSLVCYKHSKRSVEGFFKHDRLNSLFLANA